MSLTAIFYRRVSSLPREKGEFTTMTSTTTTPSGEAASKAGASHKKKNVRNKSQSVIAQEFSFHE